MNKNQIIKTTLPSVENPFKKVCVITKEVKDETGKVIQKSGIVSRVIRAYAAHLISSGTHESTTKSKLQSYLNRSIKLHRNKKTVEKAQEGKINFHNPVVNVSGVYESAHPTGKGRGKTYVRIDRNTQFGPQVFVASYANM